MNSRSCFARLRHNELHRFLCLLIGAVLLMGAMLPAMAQEIEYFNFNESLKKTIPDTPFTYEQALRAVWPQLKQDRNGNVLPGPNNALPPPLGASPDDFQCCENSYSAGEFQASAKLVHMTLDGHPYLLWGLESEAYASLALVRLDGQTPTLQDARRIKNDPRGAGISAVLAFKGRPAIVIDNSHSNAGQSYTSLSLIGFDDKQQMHLLFDAPTLISNSSYRDEDGTDEAEFYFEFETPEIVISKPASRADRPDLFFRISKVSYRCQQEKPRKILQGKVRELSVMLVWNERKQMYVEDASSSKALHLMGICAAP